MKGAFLLKKKTKDTIFIILMLSIPLLHFAIFWVYVNISSIGLAFQNSFSGEFTFENFTRFFSDWEKSMANDGPLKYAVQNTLLMLVVTNFVNMPLTVFTSFVLFKRFYGHNYFRVVFYLPGIIGYVIILTMQTYMLDATGPVIQIGKMIGIQWPFEALQSGLLGNAVTARSTFFLTRISISGSTILLLTGALNRIPQDLFDSSKLDGIGFFREFYNIALPLMWSTVGIMWVMDFAGCWSSFTEVMILTGGAYNTNNLGYYLTSHVLAATVSGSENFNYPAALGLLMTLFVAPITLLLRWLAEKMVTPVDF